MSRPDALIQPATLRWARERAGLGLAAAAEVAGLPVDRLASWEAGESRPTFRQAQALAQSLHVPFGFLFLSQVPTEQMPLPDLRTVGSHDRSEPSLDLLDTVRDVVQRQAWYVGHLRDQGAQALPFVGRFTTGARPADVAADIRRTLEAEPAEAFRLWDEYQRALIDAAERAGVLVMRSGIVGGNTHRKLDVGEFRGFAIADPIAPVVFVNLSDAPAARLFTLLHELAHVWIGSSGVSGGSPADTRAEEVFCNAVAGEFLVPEADLRREWHVDVDADDAARQAALLARTFHVSALVVMRRAHDLGLVGRDAFLQHYRQTLDAYRQTESGGGSYYRTAGAKSSKRFARAVIAEALSGRLLLREAGRLLGMQPSKIRQFALRLQS